MLRFLLAAALLAGCQTTRPPDAPASDPASPSSPMPSTASPTDPKPEPPPDGRVMGPGVGDPLAIPLGETVRHDGHAITFVRVTEDSRCPADVTCAWEGRARVALTIDGTAATLTVPTGGTLGDDEPTSLETGMIAVEVVGLDPYPGTPEAQAGAPVVLRVVTRHAGM